MGLCLQSADAFVNSHLKADVPCYLYHIYMELTGPITDEQNTRGRRIYAPEETSRSFGIFTAKPIPNVSCVIKLIGQVRSGQVRSECLTCTFRASCCSACLSRAQEKNVGGGSKGGGGDRLHWRVQGSTSSPTGIGSR